jgi:hypothetical protein
VMGSGGMTLHAASTQANGSRLRYFIGWLSYMFWFMYLSMPSTAEIALELIS